MLTADQQIKNDDDIQHNLELSQRKYKTKTFWR